MIIDRGSDFPDHIKRRLDSFGDEMWLYRDRTDGMPTLRAINSYRGESNRGYVDELQRSGNHLTAYPHDSFAYLTQKIRITPNQLIGTPLARPKYLHFVCGPDRAAAILAEVMAVTGWHPITVYEPIPNSCIPEELPNLEPLLPKIDILR